MFFNILNEIFGILHTYATYEQFRLHKFQSQGTYLQHGVLYVPMQLMFFDWGCIQGGVLLFQYQF